MIKKQKKKKKLYFAFVVLNETFKTFETHGRGGGASQ